MSSSARWRAAVVVLALAIGSAASGAAQTPQPAQPRAAQDEFLPIDQLPPGETLPAARLLIAAYAVVWIGLAGYLWSIWQRLGRVERELSDVSRRVQESQAQRSRPGGGPGR